jgi:2-oxoglutarate ferredoxin oxidoreductase subunit gamma
MNNQHNEIILAGFGGQGILFIGKVLASAGLAFDKEVSWLPSYGPEMRGGTANCRVIISENPIGSPYIVNPTMLIAMNKPSLEKFEDTVVPGGFIAIDSALITQDVKRTDVTVIKIPATKIAADMGMRKSANMILLGKFVKETGIMTLDELKEGVKKSVPASKTAMLEANFKAVEIGYES